MPKLMIVGEHLSLKEVREHDARPFSDSAGQILDMMLRPVGLSRKDIYLTNVFMTTPSETSGNILSATGGKLDGIPGYPAIKSGKYIRQEFQPELDRLYAEILQEAPNVIVTAGPLALWALAGTSGLRKARGAPLSTGGPARKILGDIKLLPTYSPVTIRSEWKLRPVMMADLDKAKREAEFPEIRRPFREFWLAPTLQDLYDFEDQHMPAGCDLSTDIETNNGQITCIGFAPSPQIALVIPFIDPLAPDGNYWKTPNQEKNAWRFVKRICETHPHIGQNFIYDMQYLWKVYGIRCFGHKDDTMLLHHSLQPEMEKGLGFLGSVYTDEPAWKFMRARGSDIVLKKED